MRERTATEAGGFTLMEMLIVTVILGLAAAAVMPQFARAAARMELRQAAEDLAAVVRYGQMRAMMSGRSGRLGTAAQAFWLEEEEAGGPAFAPVRGRWGRRTVLARSLILDPPAEPVLFPPDGRLAPAALRLCRDSACLRVAVDRRRVKIEEDDAAEIP